MQLKDSWLSPHAMLDAFIEEMRDKGSKKGNPPQEIDYKDLPVGSKVDIEKHIDKC